MNDVFRGSEFICAHIYELLVLTKVNKTDHVHIFELNLNTLREKYSNEILKILSLERPKWNM